MNQIVFCTAGTTEALKHARNQLIHWGYPVATAPGIEATHLLLPVPSFRKDGFLQGGVSLDAVLSQLPATITVLGGMLPPLSQTTVDFLKDEFYLAENAAITARCAVRLLQKHIHSSVQGLPILIIGWGRIGKCLAEQLRAMGARVSLAVRSQKDMAILNAMGYSAGPLEEWDLRAFAVIYNTAPARMFHEKQADDTAILIDLASQIGIEGDRAIRARGLPNDMAPEASGLLIAKTALRYALRKE